MPPRRTLAVLVTAALAVCACERKDEADSATMMPGSACLSCHDGTGAPAFTAAGTVYASGAAAADAGLGSVTVTLVGSGQGESVTLTTNSAGNFFTTAALTPPITASVTRGVSTGAMAAGTGGDCGSCHAPGTGVHPTRVHVGLCASCHA